MTQERNPSSSESNPAGAASVRNVAAPVNPSRRRLVSGAAAGAGVLLSVHAKTALGAGVCQSPSAATSGNTSPRPGNPAPCSGGRSPGFWKVPQHFQYWGAWAPATFKVPVEACATGLGNVNYDDILDQGTIADQPSILPGAPPGVGVWAILAFPTMWPGGELMRTLLSAYLNANYWPDYPVTTGQILEMWNATKSGGQYCPDTSCGVDGWTATEVIAYIKGMYDINAEVLSDVCKAAT